MKQNFKLFSLALLLMMFTQISITFAQGVGINDSGNPPDPSAMMDVASTNKGVLIPRMTTSQMLNISSPAKGLF